jgi:hypothetical protein
MKNNFLGAVAAFAFVATGVATHAQEGKSQENKGAERAPVAAPRAENGGPAPRADGPKAAEGERQPGAAMKRNEAQKGPEGEQQPGGATPRKDAPKAAQGERREENGAAPKTEAPKAAQGERREQDGSPRKDATRADAPRNDQPKAAQSDKRGTPDVTRQGQNGDAKPQNGEAKPQNGEVKTGRTTARGEPRVSGVKISTEHAVRIGETLRHGAHSERPNFEVRVGVRVPEGFAIRPLPREIVEIEPEYRGYDYFVDADDQIVFVSPETHEIVGTIDYEGRAAAVDAPRAARPCPPEE